MIGKKFFKHDFSVEEYEQCVEWCNNTGLGYMKDVGDAYECIYAAEELEKMRRTRSISELKQKLANTDYKAIKFAEGIISAEEYEPTRLERIEWRRQINELEVDKDDLTV